VIAKIIFVLLGLLGVFFTVGIYETSIIMIHPLDLPVYWWLMDGVIASVFLFASLYGLNVHAKLKTLKYQAVLLALCFLVTMVIPYGLAYLDIQAHRDNPSPFNKIKQYR